MKPLRLKVKNFASYREEELDFTQLPPLVAVVGVNGAGKSSLILDAMTFVLFNQARGTTAAGTGIENLIHQGETQLEVDFTFSLNDHVYRVLRKRSTQSHELELWIDDVSHGEKIKETEAKLRQLLRLNYDTLLDTVCLGQGKSGSFMSKKPDERKSVLGEVLGLERYDILEQASKVSRKEVRERWDVVKRKVEDLSDRLEQLPDWLQQAEQANAQIGVLQVNLTKSERELEREILLRQRLELAIRERQQALQRREDATQRVTQARKQLATEQAAFDRLQSLRVDIPSLEAQLGELESTFELNDAIQRQGLEQRGRLEAALTTLTQQANAWKEKHHRLEQHGEGDCEVCGQVIESTHRASSLQRFKDEFNVLRQEVLEVRAGLQALQGQLDAQETVLKTLRRERQELTSKLTTARDNEGKLRTIQEKLTLLETQERVAVTEHAAVWAQDVPIILNEVPRDNELRKQVQELRRQLDNTIAQASVADHKLTELEQDASNLALLKQQDVALLEEYTEWDDLVKAWSKTGIQALIIENALPELERDINEILGLLSDARSSIEFHTQREKKSKQGEMIETLDVLVRDEYGVRTYETYSGGERFRVDLACHVGLATFLAKRAGAAIRFFILDEGVGSQDASTKSLVYRCMQQLSTRFDNVLVISHIEDFVEEFEHRLLVYKDGLQGSKIKLVSS